MKRFLTALLCGALLLQPVLIKAAPEAGTEAGAEESHTAGPEVSSPSAFLAEASTGKVIYEKKNNYQTINKIILDKPIETMKLKIKCNHPGQNIPATIFQIIVTSRLS